MSDESALFDILRAAKLTVVTKAPPASGYTVNGEDDKAWLGRMLARMLSSYGLAVIPTSGAAVYSRLVGVILFEPLAATNQLPIQNIGAIVDYLYYAQQAEAKPSDPDNWRKFLDARTRFGEFLDAFKLRVTVVLGAVRNACIVDTGYANYNVDALRRVQAAAQLKSVEDLLKHEFFSEKNFLSLSQAAYEVKSNAKKSPPQETLLYRPFKDFTAEQQAADRLVIMP